MIHSAVLTDHTLFPFRYIFLRKDGWLSGGSVLTADTRSILLVPVKLNCIFYQYCFDLLYSAASGLLINSWKDWRLARRKLGTLQFLISFLFKTLTFFLMYFSWHCIMRNQRWENTPKKNTRAYWLKILFLFKVFLSRNYLTLWSPVSVGRVTVDLIRRSWVRFPPRSKEFFLYLVWFPDSLY